MSQVCPGYYLLRVFPGNHVNDVAEAHFFIVPFVEIIVDNQHLNHSDLGQDVVFGTEFQQLSRLSDTADDRAVVHGPLWLSSGSLQGPSRPTVAIIAVALSQLHVVVHLEGVGDGGPVRFGQNDFHGVARSEKMAVKKDITASGNEKKS